MKISYLLLLAVILSLVSCGKNNVSSAKIKTKADSLSYAMGIDLSGQLKSDSLNLDPVLMAKAMIDYREGKPLMEDVVARSVIITYMNERQMAAQAKEAEINKVRFAKNIQQGDSFLQKNRENTGVVVTESGLQYKIIKQGKGNIPTENDEVKVNYTGTFINGNVFDSSEKNNGPAQFKVNGVIAGWIEGLQLMPAGSKFMLYVPENLAYGAEGRGPIEPYTTLIFEVELLEIVK